MTKLTFQNKKKKEKNYYLNTINYDIKHLEEKENKKKESFDFYSCKFNSNIPFVCFSSSIIDNWLTIDIGNFSCFYNYRNYYPVDKL